MFDLPTGSPTDLRLRANKDFSPVAIHALGDSRVAIARLLVADLGS